MPDLCDLSEVLQLEEVERLALADRAAGRITEDERPVLPEDYRRQFLAWLNHDPEQTEDAVVRRLMRELEVA